MEKISIIVPIYKVELYLEKCIKSIIAQSYKNLEIILVNDGSPDRCGEICERYAKLDKRIKVIHKKNGGLSSARNAGIKNATGKYIGFVDSDDWIAIDMYEYLYSLICINNADIAICEYYQARENEILDNKIIREKVKCYDKNEMIKLFFRVNEERRGLMFVWKRLYRKSLIDKVFFTEGLTSEDIDFSYKIFSISQKVVITNLKKYYYNIGNNNSITRSKVAEKNFDSLVMWDKVIAMSQNSDLEYLNYAKINKLRAEFTLLCRLALYGYDKKYENIEMKKRKLIKNLRKHYWKLLNYRSFPLKKKIVLTILCINFRVLKFLMLFHKKW